jgi:hypothetical protein
MISLADLQERVLRGPVLLAGDPFVPICLPPEIELVADGPSLAAELDTPTPHVVRPLVVLADPTPGGGRFGPAQSVAVTPAAINAGLPARLDYVQSAFLQQSAIADHISDAVAAGDYDTVLLLIVDGLGYADVRGWPWPTQPVFVNGPSITEVGYPQAVGNPPLARRLAAKGWRALGYSYWDRSNVLTERLFTGIPLVRVGHFPALLAALSAADLRGVYVQIVREGLDRLAHHRREVAPAERQATVDEIAHAGEQLAAHLRMQGRRAVIYITADHGLLWKAEHRFQPLETTDHRHPRYATTPPADRRCAAYLPVGGQSYHVYYYPYVGTKLRDNDAGVHGGCSYEESFVPLARIEVRP